MYTVTPDTFPNNIWPFNRKQWYIILNVAISNQSFSRPDSNTPFPSSIEIDWMRVYQTQRQQHFGCMDSTAINYNPDATDDDNSCDILGCTNNAYQEYDPIANLNISDLCINLIPVRTVIFTVNMNNVLYPNTEYANVVVNGSWNGWLGWGVVLVDDGDGIFTGTLEIAEGTVFDYVVAVTGVADDYSGWGIQWGNGCTDNNVTVQVSIETNEPIYTSLTPGCNEILGCIDSNAANYDPKATQQDYDTYGNLQCIFASCDDIPKPGCIYDNGFGPFNQFFGAIECTNYGGTPCIN